ncbi:MAG TPA: hypothetical protein VE753_09190 [Gaiellaceae bacterium]|nr:hypothetical protein [Gaiellaceae bacterium]
MTTNRPPTAEIVLGALLAAALVLVVVELAAGAAGPVPPKLADPCRSRPPARAGGFDAAIQRIVLDGLDGAACRLHTTREALVLSLGRGTGFRRRWDRRTIEVALRAGMLRSIDEAERRGDVPGFVAPVLRRLVRAAPLDQLVERGFRLRDLLLG